MHKITTGHLATALTVAALAAAVLAAIERRRAEQRKLYLQGVTDALTGLGELNGTIPIARAGQQHHDRR